MDILLTPEIKSLIRKHLDRRDGETPESILLKALHALQEVEALEEKNACDNTRDRDTGHQPEPREQAILQEMADEGLLRPGKGGKPEGLSGVRVKGEAMSKTVLDARR